MGTTFRYNAMGPQAYAGVQMNMVKGFQILWLRKPNAVSLFSVLFHQILNYSSTVGQGQISLTIGSIAFD